MPQPAAAKSGGWSIDPKQLSAATLVDLYNLLDGSPYETERLQIQTELVNRARTHQGLSNREIMDTLVHGVRGKRQRAAIAKAWHKALGLTEREAKRLAD